MVNRSITYVTKRSLRKMHRLQGGALWINAESVFPPFEGTCVVNQSQRFAVLLASLGDGFTTGYIDIHHRISNGPALVPGHPVDSHARSQRALNGSYVRSVNSFWNTDTPNGELLPSNGSSVAWGLTLFPPSGRSTASSSTTSYGATNDVRTIDRCIRRSPLPSQEYFTNWISSGRAICGVESVSTTAISLMPTATPLPWKFSRPSKQRPFVRHFLHSGSVWASPAFSKLTTNSPSGVRTGIRGALGSSYAFAFMQGSRSSSSPKGNPGATASSSDLTIPMTRASFVGSALAHWSIWAPRPMSSNNFTTSITAMPSWVNAHPVQFTSPPCGQKDSAASILQPFVVLGGMAALALSASLTVMAPFDSSPNASLSTQPWSMNMSQELYSPVTIFCDSTTKADASKPFATVCQRTHYCYTCDATSM